MKIIICGQLNFDPLSTDNLRTTSELVLLFPSIILDDESLLPGGTTRKQHISSGSNMLWSGACRDVEFRFPNGQHEAGKILTELQRRSLRC